MILRRWSTRYGIRPAVSIVIGRSCPHPRRLRAGRVLRRRGRSRDTPAERGRRRGVRGLTSEGEKRHKENQKETWNVEPATISARSGDRLRHEGGMGGVAGPDRGARRGAGPGLRERGWRRGRSLARRRAGAGTGPCGGRTGRHRLRRGAVRAAARTDPLVCGRGRSLSSPLSTWIGRSRPGPPAAGDGPGG